MYSFLQREQEGVLPRQCFKQKRDLPNAIFKFENGLMVQRPTILDGIIMTTLEAQDYEGVLFSIASACYEFQVFYFCKRSLEHHLGSKVNIYSSPFPKSEET